MANMTLMGFVRKVMQELGPYIKEGTPIEFDLYVIFNPRDGKLYVAGPELGIRIKFSLPYIANRYQ